MQVLIYKNETHTLGALLSTELSKSPMVIGSYRIPHPLKAEMELCLLPVSPEVDLTVALNNAVENLIKTVDEFKEAFKTAKK